MSGATAVDLRKVPTIRAVVQDPMGVTPNMGISYAAFRQCGYALTQALGDLFDNCIDGKARNIYVRVHAIPDISPEAEKNGKDKPKTKVVRILTGDDGDGIARIDLPEALRLGGIVQRPKTEVPLLGKYFVGLTMAAISITELFHLISKQKGEEIFGCSLDLNHLEEEKPLQRHKYPAGSERANEFRDMTGGADSGSLVTLEQPDRLRETDGATVVESLRQYIARVYRVFIGCGTVKFHIALNDEEWQTIDAFDPLQRDKAVTDDDGNFVRGTFIACDGEEFTVVGANGVEETLTISLTVLAPSTKKRGGTRKWGFYMMRNDREIADAEVFGASPSSHALSRLRAEIRFPDTLDEDFGVRFQKTGIDITQSLEDQINQKISGWMTTAKNHISVSEAKTPTVADKFKQAERKYRAALTRMGDKSYTSVKMTIHAGSGASLVTFSGQLGAEAEFMFDTRHPGFAKLFHDKTNPSDVICLLALVSERAQGGKGRNIGQVRADVIDALGSDLRKYFG